MEADSILVPSRLFLCYIATASLNVIKVQREVIYLNSKSRLSGNLWHQTVKAQKSFSQLWNCVCTIWNCNLIWEDWDLDPNIDSAKKKIAINLSIETNKQSRAEQFYCPNWYIVIFPSKNIRDKKNQRPTHKFQFLVSF